MRIPAAATQAWGFVEATDIGPCIIIQVLLSNGSTGGPLILRATARYALPEISEADADSDQLINFLITEWNMPGMPCMPGLEMLKHVRADARLAQLPLLMLTAEAKREQIVEGAHASVNAYVIKSFAAATLNEKIAKILAAQANCDVSRAADQSGAVS